MDDKEKEGVGPMSIMTPASERLEDTKKYFEPKSYNPDEKALADAQNMILSLIPSHSVRPRDPKVTMQLLPKGTNSGLPDLTRNRAALDDCLLRATTMRSASEMYPAVRGWRGQQSGEDIPKQRVVWMMDHAETILSSMFMGPLLELLRVHQGFAAWGTPFDVDNAVTRIIDKARERGGTIYSFDYSGFDTSWSRDMFRDLFICLHEWFVPGFSLQLSLMEEVLSTIPLVIPWDVLFGEHGMCSGSGWTNGLDSLQNMKNGFYVANRLGIDVQDCEVMGDDGVFLFSDDPSVSEISKVVAELGMTMSDTKQHVSDTTVHYLQRMHDHAYRVKGVCVGVRSPYRAISGFTSYERFRKDWNRLMDSARIISQANNCMWYPSFEQLVRVIVNEDEPLRSGMDPVEIFRQAGGPDVIRQVLGYASFPFNVSDPSGVENFAFTRTFRALP
jgi:hypothetical protein